MTNANRTEAEVAALASRQRRAVLDVLCSSDGGVPVDELAARIVAGTADESAGNALDRESTAVRLVHADLPALAGAELVERDGDVARATDRGRQVRHWLADVADATDPDALDRILECLAVGRRRRVLDAVDAADGPLSVSDLAAAVAERAAAAPTAEEGRDPEPGDDRSAIRASLVHVHLPKLAAADLVTYDADSGLVVPPDRSAVLEPTPDDGVRPSDGPWARVRVSAGR